MNSTTAKANENKNGVQVVEITSYSEDEVITKDGKRYFLEDVKEIIEAGENNENTIYKAIIVNGECTSVLKSVEDN